MDVDSLQNTFTSDCICVVSRQVYRCVIKDRKRWCMEESQEREGGKQKRKIPPLVCMCERDTKVLLGRNLNRKVKV